MRPLYAESILIVDMARKMEQLASINGNVIQYFSVQQVEFYIQVLPRGLCLCKHRISDACLVPSKGTYLLQLSIIIVLKLLVYGHSGSSHVRS